MLSAVTGKPMDLHGGGHSVRAFIHIEDVVKATLKLALEGEPGSTWHLSSQESCTIRELVVKICKICGADFNQLVNTADERLGKDQSYLLDSTAMRQIHGWTDEIKIDEGLRGTLEWVNANIDKLRTLPWSYQHKT